MDISGDKEAGRFEHELHALTEVAKALTAPLPLPELLGEVMGKLFDVLEPAEVGMILLWDESSSLLRPQAAFGCDPEIIQEIGLRADESITGRAFADGQARLLNSVAAVAEAMAGLDPANRSLIARSFGTRATPRSVLTVPLRAGEHKYGVLVLAAIAGPEEFTEDDVPFVQALADLIALAIDRARWEAEAEVTREAEQADRLRAEVMATLSHELRTPLAAIKGYSTALLLDEVEWPDEKRQEFLHLIDEECDNLETMVNDILDSSLIDVGQLVVERQPLRLQKLAREVTDDMQRRTEVHRLVVDFPSDFPIIDADPRRVTQVIRNILDNSIKYSPEGGLVVVRGEARPSDVVISIADQGVGISPEDLIPLFEKYFRVKSATGYHVAGTGLGLPVARSIVEAHGGRIWAESKVGEGTTLYFSLPRKGLSANLDEDE